MENGLKYGQQEGFDYFDKFLPAVISRMLRIYDRKYLDYIYRTG